MALDLAHQHEERVEKAASLDHEVTVLRGVVTMCEERATDELASIAKAYAQATDQVNGTVICLDQRKMRSKNSIALITIH